MKISSVETATVLRDGGIEAMDALNAIVEEVSPNMSAEERKALRRAVGRSISAILEHVVNPALREHPVLDVSEDTWGDIALARAGARLAKKG